MLRILVLLSSLSVARATLTATGRVKFHSPAEPATELSVSCYDDDVNADDFMGHGLTDSQGRYEIKLDPSVYDTWGQVDVYCQISGSNLIASGFTTTENPNGRSVIDFGDLTVYRKSAVAIGEVKYFYPQTPAAGLSVKCYDADPADSDDFMGSGTTDANGRFTVDLDPGVYDLAGQGQPDVYCLVSGSNLVTDSYSEIKSKGQTIDLVTFFVHSKREFPSCKSNSCGPVIQRWNQSLDLDYFVPDLVFGPACRIHDCCIVECSRNSTHIPAPQYCDEEFFSVMRHICKNSYLPLCRHFATLYHYAVKNYDMKAHWCAWQKAKCQVTPQECHA